MVNIGITGGTGLVGPHLRAFLDKHIDKYSYILINREDFAEENKLKKKLKQCDVIVHLAGLSNRAKAEEIFSINVDLTQKILDNLDAINHKPKIIFLSSIHRDKNTPYGLSKKESESIIFEWGKKNKTPITTIISSHIFGESPHSFTEILEPYRNSAFATFCQEIIQNKESNVYPLAKAEYVYVGDVCKVIFNNLKSKPSKETVFVRGREIFMSDIYALLKHFYREHRESKHITFNDAFESNIYNSLKSYLT